MMMPAITPPTQAAVLHDGGEAGAPAAVSASGKAALAPRVETIDPAQDAARWDRDVLEHAGHTPFHSAAWSRLLSATYRHRPCYLRIDSGKGKRALIPIAEVRSPITGRRGVCLPFSDCCDPLLPDAVDRHELRQQLAALARERRWKSLELRGESLGRGQEQPGSPTFYGHRLDLHRDPDRLFQDCDAAVRRAVRKARAADLSVRIGTDLGSLEQFYRLHCRTRRRHGLPPQSLSFFRNLCAHGLIGEGAGFVVLVERQGKALAAAVFLCFGSSALYKFGASDESAWSLRPNNLAMWEGIRTLAERGFDHLHFGRSSVDQDGLRRFKRSWGASETPIHYVHLDPRSGHWSSVKASATGKLTQAVFSHMPLAVNRLAGALIYPHLD